MPKKGLNRSFKSLANKLLQNELGYLLTPDESPNRKDIRKKSAKALRKLGWKSKYNTPYNRQKFYDYFEAYVEGVQKRDFDGRQLKSINSNISKWRKSETYKERMKKFDLPEGARVFSNPENVFEWINVLRAEYDFLMANKYTVWVVIEMTSDSWNGSAKYILSKAPEINNTIRGLEGSDFGGYFVTTDPENKIFKFTFSKIDDEE